MRLANESPRDRKEVMHASRIYLVRIQMRNKQKKKKRNTLNQQLLSQENHGRQQNRMYRYLRSETKLQSRCDQLLIDTESITQQSSSGTASQMADRSERWKIRITASVSRANRPLIVWTQNSARRLDRPCLRFRHRQKPHVSAKE